MDLFRRLSVSKAKSESLNQCLCLRSSVKRYNN